MIACLTATGRYPVLRKIEAPPIASCPPPQFPLHGVILDTETTGLNYRRDEIIEIGAITFTFAHLGAIDDINGVYAVLKQPSAPIPAEITKLTGIPDAMVAGPAIDLPGFRVRFDPADLIIVHNAASDRPFFGALSMRHSPAWPRHVRTPKSTGRRGALKARNAPSRSGRQISSTTAFAELHAATQRSRVRAFAENSPYDLKDDLKARGYRWSDGSVGPPRYSWIEIDETALGEVLHCLRTGISAILRPIRRPDIRLLSIGSRHSLNHAREEAMSRLSAAHSAYAMDVDRQG